MTTADTLRALAMGTPMDDSILPACRLESGNVDSFGAEAVGDALRRAPVAALDRAVTIAGPGHCALFTDTEALVADLWDGRIGRLWRIGQRDPWVAEPAVAVAFDPDLRQARADVFVSETDHPALDRGGLDKIASLGRALVHDTRSEYAAYRSRAFVIRAFGDASRGAGLFAIHALAANPVRTPSLTYAAVRWDVAVTQSLRDTIRPRDERVRLAYDLVTADPVPRNG